MGRNRATKTREESPRPHAHPVYAQPACRPPRCPGTKVVPCLCVCVSCVLCAPCPVCGLVPAARKPSQRYLRFGTRVDQDAATLVSGPTHATAAGFLSFIAAQR